MKSGRIRVSAKSERTLDGITFASKAERKRYAELLLLERAGEITDLEIQPRFVLLEKFERAGEVHRAITYVADFRYRLKGLFVVEDVKGMRTDVYRLKKKLFLHRYSEIDFREVEA
jgi:hypothetical protein